MERSQQSLKKENFLEEIISFVTKTSGIKAVVEKDNIKIQQMIDNKFISFSLYEVEELLKRTDVDGKMFIQINFNGGKKILLTDTLVGFKPHLVPGLDLGKLPRVVTTPDLVSVFEAIEESINSDGVADVEIEILKKVYLAILIGAEEISFNVSRERNWLDRLVVSRIKATA